MISHERASELISARMDAPLMPAEHRELQAHLAACTACRAFVSQTDGLARGLQTLPRLAPSPAVSRAVMSAVYTDNAGWGWLSRGLRALSSPGLAVASGLALVIVMSGALLLAVNGPGRGGVGNEPEGSIAALADVPVPTQAPTETAVPEPTATQPPRTIQPAQAKATEPPARTPEARPTATRPAAIEVDAALGQPAAVDAGIDTAVEQPPIEPTDGDQVLAMTPDEGVSSDGSTDLAQSANEPQDTGGGRKGGRKGGNQSEEQASAPTMAPVAAMPVPDEAITAMEKAGDVPDIPDFSLPPAPLDPLPPEQSFLPVTPTPEGEGTPTPEINPEDGVPQLAEDTSGELGVTALAPDPPTATTIEGEDSKDRKKRDKSADGGKSVEQEQGAFIEEPVSWWAGGVELPQTADYPAEETGTGAEAQIDPTTGLPIDSATGLPYDPATGLLVNPTTGRNIDPTTGLDIDPTSGLLIDPATGYLLDLVNNRIIHPGTGFVVDPFTGLLIDPGTGALLDPVTLEMVVPPGFGSDTPTYIPGGDMHGEIEAVVDDTYNNATYKIEPPTDGPTQPIGEIIVPTESGDALEVQ